MSTDKLLSLIAANDEWVNTTQLYNFSNPCPVLDPTELGPICHDREDAGTVSCLSKASAQAFLKLRSAEIRALSPWTFKFHVLTSILRFQFYCFYLLSLIAAPHLQNVHLCVFLYTSLFAIFVF